MAEPNILVVFNSRGQLIDAMDAILRDHIVDGERAAIIAKAEEGEVTVLDDDVTPVEGAAAGGSLGALIAMLGVAQLGAFLLPGVGPIVAIAAGALAGGLIGSATGGTVANLIDGGFKQDDLSLLTTRLKAGEVGMVLPMPTADQLAALRTAVDKYGGSVLSDTSPTVPSAVPPTAPTIPTPSASTPSNPSIQEE